ncbi:MAG: fatty acid desaturase, partial [Flavobacteriales bacterium]
PFLYSLMTFYWVIGKDFKQLKGYHTRGLLKKEGLTLSKAMPQVIIYKTGYLLLTLGLPILMLQMPWYHVLMGFVAMHLITGLILSFIFQTAHVINETDFYTVEEDGSVENNWAVHQMKTTANFANNNKLLSWYVGGLNFQIEHHLFPHICHVHYKAISDIVKRTAKEFNVPYYEHKTFFGALKSHFSLVYQLGTGKYDKKMRNT